MKVSRKQAAENRGRIVEQAARLFREYGVAGIGVGEITAAAGLTHGGFYRQFESKHALFAEACNAALKEVGKQLAAAMRTPGGLKTFNQTYLRDEHVHGPSPCPIVTLASDVARSGAAGDLSAQAAFADGLRAFLAGGKAFEPGEEKWNEVTAGLAAAIGAMLMARAVAGADPDLADAIVAAVRP